VGALLLIQNVFLELAFDDRKKNTSTVLLEEKEFAILTGVDKSEV
jgi:hypothetical protein